MPSTTRNRFAFLAAAVFALGAFTACVSDPEDEGPGETINDPADPNAAADTSAANVTWSSTATAFRGQDNRRVAYDCPADGFFTVVWGTDIYTDDSSVCTAAVHAGKITKEAGGRVVIEIRPGEDSYESSTRNGVTSSSWPSWGGSFIFP